MQSLPSSIVCFVAVKLLPPSSFEMVHSNPVAEFTQTVGSIIKMLDEYSLLRYGHIPLFVCVCYLRMNTVDSYIKSTGWNQIIHCYYVLK